MRARVGATKSHREPERDRERSSKSQREPEWEYQRAIESQRQGKSQCYKKEASLTFLAYLNIVLLQNN